MASILPSDAPWSAKDVVTLPTSQRHPFVAWRAFQSKSEDTGFSTSSHRCLLAGEQPAEEPEPIQCRRRHPPQRVVTLHDGKIGRANVGTPVTNAQLVTRHL